MLTISLISYYKTFSISHCLFVGLHFGKINFDQQKKITKCLFILRNVSNTPLPSPLPLILNYLQRTTECFINHISYIRNPLSFENICFLIFVEFSRNVSIRVHRVHRSRSYNTISCTTSFSILKSFYLNSYQFISIDRFNYYTDGTR